MSDLTGRSYVVTGSAGGVGRGIVGRLLGAGAAVVGLDRPDAHQPGRDGLVQLAGDAADEAVCGRAVEAADALAPFAGWVNNAVVFRDVDLAADGARAVGEVVAASLALALAGGAAAIRHLLAHDRPGAIVNVSSHQAQRAVRGALAYATAKAALEGLTRSLAVDHGPAGIRVNAVALGSIRTARYDAYLAGLDAADATSVEAQMARLHPLGRVGTPEEVGDVVAWLLSDAAAYVSGAVIPVDGGRAAQGDDPEAR